MCVIEFHGTAADVAGIPHPYPASQHLPEWFKSMPADVGEHPTLKRCPPLLTAMTAGYIIPAPNDTSLTLMGAGMFSERGQGNIFSTHFPKQFEGSPFAGNSVVKFDNPWIMVTPPGYVCLITAPVNRYEIPFLPLTGIVETDAYYKEVKLPMICLMQPGETFHVRRGDPLIQVIPIRREEWTSKTVVMDHARRAEQQARFDANPHTYKDEFWKKMVFA